VNAIIQAILQFLSALFGGLARRADPLVRPVKKALQPSKLKNIEIIKAWEGLRLSAYQDTGGVWTIGYGDTHDVKPGMVITKQEAERRLYEDIKWVEGVLNSTVKVPITQKQYDALGSFVYNIGGTQFRNSTLLRKLNAYDYVGAANEFPKWKYDNGKVIRGLINRRRHEQELFIEGMTSEQHEQPKDVQA